MNGRHEKPWEEHTVQAPIPEFIRGNLYEPEGRRSRMQDTVNPHDRFT